MSRPIGLKDIHIATIESDTSTATTYKTPEKLERAIKAKISPKSNSETLYSDDSVEEVLEEFESCDVEIELNQLSVESRAKLQGAKIDSNGVLIESKNDIAPEIALGFKAKKSNGKYRYIWLLKGKFSLTEDEYETKTDKPNAKTSTLKGTFYARESDEAWRFKVDQDGEGVNDTVITNWFKNVYEPSTTPVTEP